MEATMERTQLEVDERIIEACRVALAAKREERVRLAREHVMVMAEKYYADKGATQVQHASGYISLLVQLYDALMDNDQYDEANEIKDFLRENFIDIQKTDGRGSRWAEIRGGDSVRIYDGSI